MVSSNSCKPPLKAAHTWGKRVVFAGGDDKVDSSLHIQASSGTEGIGLDTIYVKAALLFGPALTSAKLADPVRSMILSPNSLSMLMPPLISNKWFELLALLS